MAYLVCVFPVVLFVSISQVIGCEDRLRSDLYIVSAGAWGVKLYCKIKLYHAQFKHPEASTSWCEVSLPCS